MIYISNVVLNKYLNNRHGGIPSDEYLSKEIYESVDIISVEDFYSFAKDSLTFFSMDKRTDVVALYFTRSCYCCAIKKSDFGLITTDNNMLALNDSIEDNMWLSLFRRNPSEEDYVAFNAFTHLRMPDNVTPFMSRFSTYIPGISNVFRLKPANLRSSWYAPFESIPQFASIHDPNITVGYLYDLRNISISRNGQNVCVNLKNVAVGRYNVYETVKDTSRKVNFTNITLINEFLYRSSSDNIVCEYTLQDQYNAIYYMIRNLGERLRQTILEIIHSYDKVSDREDVKRLLANATISKRIARIKKDLAAIDIQGQKLFSFSISSSKVNFSISSLTGANFLETNTDNLFINDEEKRDGLFSIPNLIAIPVQYGVYIIPENLLEVCDNSKIKLELQGTGKYDKRLIIHNGQRSYQIYINSAEMLERILSGFSKILSEDDKNAMIAKYLLTGGDI